jgi:hypothetical protein
VIIVNPLFVPQPTVPAGQAQLPETHANPTMVEDEHVLPHPPQLFESVIGLTHAAPQAI